MDTQVKMALDLRPSIPVEAVLEDGQSMIIDVKKVLARKIKSLRQEAKVGWRTYSDSRAFGDSIADSIKAMKCNYRYASVMAQLRNMSELHVQMKKEN